MASGPCLDLSAGHRGVAGGREPQPPNRAQNCRTQGWAEGGGKELGNKVVRTNANEGPPMRIEEDVDEGGGDGWQSLRVQREDAESVLWALDGVHRGAGPCWGGLVAEVKGRLWASAPPGGQPERDSLGWEEVTQHLQEATWVLPAPSCEEGGACQLVSPNPQPNLHKGRAPGGKGSPRRGPGVRGRVSPC